MSAAGDPASLPIDEAGNSTRRPGDGPLLYRVGVVLLGHTRAWGPWMEQS